MVRANRFSFELHHRALVDNEQALHTCDTPGCVNPRHLFAGTAQDNTDDMIAKGRHAPGRLTSVKAREMQELSRLARRSF